MCPRNSCVSPELLRNSCAELPFNSPSKTAKDHEVGNRERGQGGQAQAASKWSEPRCEFTVEPVM